MDETYFLGRMRESQAMAWAAKSATAKLIHFDLAGRYSAAANAASQARFGSDCEAIDQAGCDLFVFASGAEAEPASSASSSSRRWRFSIASDASTSRCVSAMLARNAA
jgi:hypothetical protein